MTTHYAVLYEDTVIGTRSSTSRSIRGTGRYGPYTHAVVQRRHEGGLDVISWHGSQPAANTARHSCASHHTARYGVVTAADYIVVPVTITAKRLTVATAIDPREKGDDDGAEYGDPRGDD